MSDDQQPLDVDACGGWLPVDDDPRVTDHVHRFHPG